MRLISLILLSFLIGSMQSIAQSSDAYRNKNWNPKAGKYFFSTALTWTFENEITDEEHLKSGEMTVYVDEKTGTFLFTKEAFGWSGEMIDYVIADQNGNFIIGHTDEFGKKHVESKKVDSFAEIGLQKKQIESDFRKYCKPTGKSKNFGKNSYGWPIIKGNEYVMTYQKTSDKTNLFLSKSKYSLLPLFLFDKLDMDARLPIAMDFSMAIPTFYFPLQSEYEWNGKKSTFTFISASPTEYFIDIKQK